MVSRILYSQDWRKGYHKYHNFRTVLTCGVLITSKLSCWAFLFLFFLFSFSVLGFGRFKTIPNYSSMRRVLTKSGYFGVHRKSV